MRGEDTDIKGLAKYLCLPPSLSLSHNTYISLRFRQVSQSMCQQQVFVSEGSVTAGCRTRKLMCRAVLGLAVDSLLVVLEVVFRYKG